MSARIGHIAAAATRGRLAGESRSVMIEHADGTITRTSEEFFASAGLNEQLAELGTSGQKRCARIQSWNGTAAEVEWGIYIPGS